MLFTWDSEFSVSIDEIDDQHQQYFKITNKLGRFLESFKKGDEVKLHLIFDELLNYAFYHLSTEENYFSDCQYSGTESHIAIHDVYRVKMRNYRQQIREIDSGFYELGVEVQNFATEWLMNHIKHTDKLYVPTLTKCLNKKTDTK